MKKLFPIVAFFLMYSCRSSQCVIYNLNDYKDEFGNNQIPPYDPSNEEWVRADHILKKIVAPARWGTRRHRTCGLESRLYVLTNQQNHKKIKNALPTLWHP